MMQDPTKKWTQRNLREMSSDKNGENFSRSLDFVDDMMRLKDDVFKAQSLQKTIHHYAISKEPITNETYEYIQDESRRFRSLCSSIELNCIIHMSDKIFRLKLSKTKANRLMSILRTTDKFIVQVKKNPQNDKDFKKIIHNHITWKRS
jgi:hypothetical protein